MTLHPLVVEIEVVPTQRQGHKGWWIDHGDRIKIYHKEPESRDANEYVMKSIAEALHISHSHVTILKGVESRFKEIRIGGDITREVLLEKLDVQVPEEKK